MQGFSQKTPTRAVTFTRGRESITFVVTPPPAFYALRVQTFFPPPDGDDKVASSLYWQSTSLILLAASLPEEDLPSPPLGERDRGAWQAHAQQLREIFTGAGLTERQIRALEQAAQGLAETTDHNDDLGNSSAPDAASGAA